jgi:hypothetical protein
MSRKRPRIRDEIIGRLIAAAACRIGGTPVVAAGGVVAPPGAVAVSLPGPSWFPGDCGRCGRQVAGFACPGCGWRLGAVTPAEAARFGIGGDAGARDCP